MKSVVPASDRPLRAFSLIEVVLALGIISFALVALLGVTVVGTNAGREGKNDTDFGYVFEQVAGQLRTKPFSREQTADADNPNLFPLPRLDQNTPAGEPARFYLDDQNQVVPENRGNKRVSVSIFDPAPLGELSAPKVGTTYPYRGNLAHVRVLVERYPISADKTDAAIYYTEICPLQQ